MSESDQLCYCDSAKAFSDCCAPVLAGAKARTAEALMRSRYSAYVLGDIEHLIASSSKRQRRHLDPDGAREWSSNAQWLGLEVLRCEDGDADSQTGVVEFAARYRVGEREARHHEIAHFRREQGEWRYDEGEVLGQARPQAKANKVGRNEPCPCGSGKKYKKCCAAQGRREPFRHP